MHRLPLILCAVALLASTASAVLYFQIGNSKQILELRLADANTRATKLDTALATANEQSGSLKAQLSARDREIERANSRVAVAEAHAVHLDRELTQTRNDLAAAKSDLAQTKTDLTQARSDTAQVKTVLAVYESTARALADEIASLRQDLADSRASSGSPEAVLAYKNTIAELERQLAEAKSGAAAPTILGGATAVLTGRGGRATVLTVGPENAFVVLNFGSARGASIGQKLNVSQGSDVVATVLISDVRTNYSVAQVLPDTLRGVLQKGDLAVLVR